MITEYEILKKGWEKLKMEIKERKSKPHQNVYSATHSCCVYKMIIDHNDNIQWHGFIYSFLWEWGWR